MKTLKMFRSLEETMFNKMVLTLAVIAFCAATCVLQANAAPPEFAGPLPLNPIQNDQRFDFTVAQDPHFTGGVFFEVPLGYMFMLQEASVSLSFPSGQSPVFVRLNGGLNAALLNISTVFQGSGPAQDNYVGTEDAHWYFPPGNNVGYEVLRTGDANPALAIGRISISGILLECVKEIICPSP